MITFYIHSAGYNVADFMEATEFLSITWTEYFDGKIGIEKVIEAYEKHGFDANQDLPGNVYWEELYNASPKGTKVILTVRDSDDIWQRSLKGYFIQEMKRDAIFGISVMGFQYPSRVYNFLNSIVTKYESGHCE